MATSAVATLVLAIKAVDMTSGGVGSAMRNLALLGAGGAVVALTAGAVKTASAYQTMTTSVMNNTTMGVAGMAAMEAGINRLASGSSAPLDQLAMGWMHATNMGFTAAQSFQIVKAGMESALSTGSNVSDTVNTLASVMHEFANQNLGAATAMDTLHMAAAQGNSTLEQFTTGASGAMSMAANMGIPFEQVAAALAALSRHESIDKANTQLVGMFSKIVNGSQAARKELAKLSAIPGNPNLVQDFTPAGMAAKGVTGVMADLQKATHGNTQELFSLIPALRGGMGAMLLTGTAASDYKTILASLEQTMSGKLTPTAAAYAQYQMTLGAQTGILGNNIQLLAIKFGTMLLPAVTNAEMGLSRLIKAADPNTLLRLVMAAGAAVGVFAAYRAGVIAVALAQGAWNVVTTIGAGIQAGFRAVVAAGAAIIGVARGAMLLYAAANEFASLAVLGLRLGIVQQTVVTAIMTTITGAARVATTLWTGATVLLTGAIDLVKGSLMAAIVWTEGFNVAAMAAKVAVSIWTGVQWLLNVALDANPLALIIIGVAAFTAGVIWAYQNVKPFRDLVDLLFQGFKLYLTPAIWAVTTAFNAMQGPISALGGWLTGILGDAFSFVTTQINNLLKTLSNFLGVISKFPGASNVIDPILKSLKDAEKLLINPSGMLSSITSTGLVYGPPVPPSYSAGPDGSPTTTVPGLPTSKGAGMTVDQWVSIFKGSGLTAAQMGKELKGSGLTAAQIAQVEKQATAGPALSQSTIASRNLAAQITLLADQYKHTLSPTTLAAYTADVKKQFMASGVGATLAGQLAQQQAAQLKATDSGSPDLKAGTVASRNLTAQIKLLSDQYKTTLNPTTLAAYTTDVQKQLVASGVTATLARQLAQQDASQLAASAGKAATASAAPRNATFARGIYGTQQRVTPGDAVSAGTTVAVFGGVNRNDSAKVIAALQQHIVLLQQALMAALQTAANTGRIANHMDRAATNMGNSLRARGIPHAG